MPEQKAQVAEAPAIKAAEQDEKFPTTTADTSVGDSAIDEISDIVEGLEAETSDAAEESSTSDEKTDAAVKAAVEAVEGNDDIDEIEQFTKKEDTDKKDNVQKRIDQLTAKIKQLEEENGKLKPQDTQKKVKYTDDQLKAALRKASDEGDVDLQWEIMKYMKDAAKEEILEMYNEEKNRVVGSREAINREWQSVVKNYSTAWQNDDGAEIYNGASKELSLTDGNSLLYRLAMKFYTETVDDDGRPVYQREGGQRLAVADALTAILKKRKLAPVDKEKRQLERKLVKAKVRTTVPSTSISEGEKPRKSSGSPLSDYIAERRKFRNERM